MASLRQDLNQPFADFGPRTLFTPTIPVSKWTRVINRLVRSRPLHVTVDTSYGFRHPWHCRVRYSAKFRFEINIHPGFVNAREVLVRVDGRDAPAATLARLGLKAAPKSRVSAWLSESPPIMISPSLLRPIGDDPEGLGGETVPEYFRPLGVGGEDYQVTTNLEELTRTVALTGEFPDAKTRRRLRACEIVLTQPRPALRMTFGEDEGEPALQLAIDVPSDPSPILSVRRAWSGSPAVSGLEQLLLGATDAGEDEIHLATVYLLSPVGAADGSDPDGSWTPYIQHRCWWNLRHDVNQELQTLPDQRVRLPGLGLAGGIGDALIAGAVMANESAQLQALALLNRSRIEGRFWSV